MTQLKVNGAKYNFMKNPRMQSVIHSINFGLCHEYEWCVWITGFVREKEKGKNLIVPNGWIL